jgi:hypothetical protein
MEDNNQLSYPEEDEDLEALRLAALQSLKRKSNNELQSMDQFGGLKDRQTHFNGSPRGKHKRGKFPRLQQGRPSRNVSFSVIASDFVNWTNEIPFRVNLMVGHETRI